MNRSILGITLATVMMVCSSPLLTAQRLTGQYVVIDSAVVGRVDDESAVATRVFRYNDTVRAVRRSNDTIIVKYRDLAYRLPLKSVVKDKEFKRYRKNVAVISDSAEVRTEQSTIWIRKGAVLPYLGDADAERHYVQIYGQRATVQRRDVVMLQMDPNAHTLQDSEDDTEQRPFRVRPGVSFGAAVPLSDVDYLDGGFSWAASLDVRISSNNFFLTVGYSSTIITFEQWTDINRTAQFEMLHAGVIVGLTSEMSTVVPYASLNLGLLASDGDALLVGGLGLEYYTTPQLIAFAEAMPTFHLDSGTFFWLPIRVGLKYGF